MLAACGGGAPPPPVAAAEPSVDGRTAEKEARSLVAEIYGTLARGQTDSLFSLLGDPLIVYGPRKVDAMTTRSDALVALGKVMAAKDKRRLQSSGLSVVASPGGHSAWASDVVSFEGQQLAVIAILANSDDIWAVTAGAVAETPSGKQVKVESARDAVVPPGGAAAGKVDAGASAAVDRFRKGLLDQQLWGDDLASRSDAIVVGPTAGEVARGKQAIRRAWKARMKANVRAAISGDLAAVATPDGQLAWISVPVTRVADGQDPLPLRVFAVYESDGDAWRLIALHESLALDEPGSGTAFKKIMPPAPERIEPEPAPAPTTRKKVKPKRKPRPRPAD